MWTLFHLWWENYGWQCSFITCHITILLYCDHHPKLNKHQFASKHLSFVVWSFRIISVLTIFVISNLIRKKCCTKLPLISEGKSLIVLFTRDIMTSQKFVVIFATSGSSLVFSYYGHRLSVIQHNFLTALSMSPPQSSQ